MTKTILRLLLVCSMLALAACATTTPYEPAGSSGYGYATQQLESNRFRISFSGNEKTSSTTVRNYLLYRAAEVTLEHGDDYFVVAHQNTDRKVNYNTTNVGFFGAPFFYGVGFGLGGTATTTPINRYSAYGVITVHKGDKPADNTHAYDARQVEANLGSLIKRPQK